MAGIHLPDIGKLGIHVAAGVNDKKKVAPMNLVEEARLKAFLNRVENEKHERSRVIKKELRRMKRRKRRIDQRLEDLERSKTIALKVEKKTASCTILPPILKSSPVRKKPRKKRTIREEEEVILYEDNSAGLVSKTTVFPIQDELQSSSSNSDKASALPPISPHKEKLQDVKVKSDKSRRKMSKDRKTSSESLGSKITKKTSVALQSNGTAEVDSNDGDQYVSVEDTTLILGFDARGILPRKQPQQSLEDALNAIKACRYIRTPSELQNNENDVYIIDNSSS